MNNYTVGTKLMCNEVEGTVVENYKLPGDVCIDWEDGTKSSYDKTWLDENARIIIE